MNDDLNFQMTDLEERLVSMDGPAVQSEVLNTLSTSGEEIANKIKAGLPPDEFQNAEKVYQALAAAHEIVSVFPVGKPEDNAT